ncbi:MAG: molybdopterin-dependent oxidoreductase [Lachnospiraceae bacterium]|nr:molybdopterin-dependent oxidoreductase [Lachnospiraceae bacterium]
MSRLFERILDARFSRRNFLKTSAAATAAVAGLSLAGCAKSDLSTTTTAAADTTAAGSAAAKTTEADTEAAGTEAVKEHDPVEDIEGKGEWKTAACWNNCGGRCLNKALVVDGVVVRQKTDDTHPDSPDYLQQRACVRGRARRYEVYAPDRLKSPMKRKSWQPGGKDFHGELRGIDEWEEITWEEAFKYVADEVKRIADTYGPRSLFATSAGDASRILNAVGGCLLTDGTLSWGSWYEGPDYFGMEDGFGEYSTNDRLDLRNSELIVMFGSNPAWSSGGSPTYSFLQAKKAGAKFVVIDPIYTETCATMEAQWIPIHPGTDHALLLALAYVMLENDEEKKLIDWDFLNACTIGFDAEHLPEGADPKDNIKDYILGTYDNTPKTPEWASEITGVDASVIKELALSMGKDVKVALLTGWAPARTHNSDSMPQMFMTLGAMGGHMGRSGHMTGVSCHYGAGNGGKNLVGAGGTGISMNKDIFKNTVGEVISQSEMWDAICRGNYVSGDGETTDIDVKLIYHGGTNAHLQTMPGINRGIEAHRKVEFVVSQTTFYNTSAKYSDIVLPVNSMWERRDGWMGGGNREILVNAPQLIEPLWDSKSDREVVVGVLAAMGIEEKEAYSLSAEAGWFNRYFGAWTYDKDGETRIPLVTITQEDIDNSGVKDELEAAGIEVKPQEGVVDYKKFVEDGVYTVERKEGDNYGSIAYKAFRDDPEANPLETESGKLEIYCKALQDAVNGYGYTKINAYPSYNPCLDGYEQMKADGKYEFQVINSHYMRRSHTILDNVKVMREAFPNPVLISAEDAAAKNIKDGDTVLLTSEHGKTLRNACVTETMMPGVISVLHGCWEDLDEETGIDRAGADNILTGQICTGQRICAWNSTLCNMEKYSKDALDEDVNMNSRLIEF